ATLALADGLLLTSRFEAWPMVILEAFAAGISVFAYDCPSGPKEMLGSGARGRLTGESPREMAEAIISYFESNTAERDDVIAAAKSYGKQFEPQAVIQCWEGALWALAHRERP